MTILPRSNHKKLIDDCYPPAKSLPSAAPSYSPNSAEASRLTYYAANRPEKLVKVGAELERRVRAGVYGIQDQRKRAGLLITLNLLNSLIHECRRSLNLFARPVLSIVELCLTSPVPLSDLEVREKACSVFAAYTTYTDGTQIGIDDALTATYLAVLRKLGTMAASEADDLEMRNRTRLLAILTLHSAVASDATYHTAGSEFKRVAQSVVPALFENLFVNENKVSLLREEAETLVSNPVAPGVTSSALPALRPALSERRARSIHAHVDGEKGPSTTDVAASALSTLRELCASSNGVQLASVLVPALGWLDNSPKRWRDAEWASWFAASVTEWTALQYRYVVPTTLLSVLSALQDNKAPTTKHHALVDMLHTVFNSKTSLVGLSTSEVLSELLDVVVRRVCVDTRDALLPPLVATVGALGTHIYWNEQIQSLAESIIARIVEVQFDESSAAPSAEDPEAQKQKLERSETLRVFLACLSGVLATAYDAEPLPPPPLSPGLAEGPQFGSEPQKDKGKAPARIPALALPEPSKQSTRSRVSPESFQETVALLAEPEYALRAAYVRALHAFLEGELVQEEGVGTDTLSHVAAAGAGRIIPDSLRPSGAVNAAVERFLNALNVSVYTLATSRNLAAPAPPVPDASTDSSPSESASAPTGPQVSVAPPSPGATTPDDAVARRAQRARKTSAALSRLEPSALLSTEPPASPEYTATPSDYSAILGILLTTQRKVPGLALLATVPLLLALDRAAAVMGLGFGLKRKGTRRGSTASWHQGSRQSSSGRRPSTAIQMSAVEALKRDERAAGVEEAVEEEDTEADEVDGEASGVDERSKRRALRELVARAWWNIGDFWGIDDLQTLASKALNSLGASVLTAPPQFDLSEAPPLVTPQEPQRFPAEDELSAVHDGESSSTPKPLIDPTAAVALLASSSLVQSAVGADAKALTEKLAKQWSVQNALKSSVERRTSFNNDRGDSTSPFTAVAPALMQIDNASTASVLRSGQSTRGVGVGDLREALGDRKMSASAMNLNAMSTRTPSISTAGTGFTHDGGRATPRRTTMKRTNGGGAPAKEVNEILNRLVVGKTGPNGTLKGASYPLEQSHGGSRVSVLTAAPYSQ